MQLDSALFRFSLLLLFIPLLGGSLCGLLLEIKDLLRRQKLSTWFMLQATVLEQTLEQNEQAGCLGGTKFVQEYVAHYCYEIHGQSFTASAVLGRQKILSSSEKKLAICVNPNNLEQSVSAPKNDTWRSIRLIVLITGCILSVYILYSIFD